MLLLGIHRVTAHYSYKTMVITEDVAFIHLSIADKIAQYRLVDSEIAIQYKNDFNLA